MSAAPIKWNLKLYQGATFRERRVWKLGDTVPTATPVDLTGCTARMQVRTDIDSPDVLVALTTENGGITLGAEPGAIDLYLSDEQTAALAFDQGVYDLEVAFANGDVRRLFAGTVTLNPEVTR